MLDVRRLRVLREVAAQGSFSAAAEALSYTQSAVSQQIAALEREAGTTLVERGARGIRLTDAGEALVRHADAILARLAEAEAELEAIAGLRGGRLRIGTFPSVGASLVPPAVAAFRKRHPGVELALSLFDDVELGVSGLRAGTFDIALTIEDTLGPPPDDELERIDLLDDPMYVAVPRDHPLARRRRVRLADLASEHWLIGTSTASCPDARLFARACHGAGFEPHVALQNDDYNAIQGFVASGVGVAPIPELALLSPRDDIVIHSLGPDTPHRRICAATLAGSYRSPATTAMLEILKETAEEYVARRRPPLVAVS